MPLPAKAKEPPPTGYTGRFGLEVTKDVLDQWFSENNTSKSNIAIHLGFGVILPDGRVDPTSGNGYCVIGLDVDENDDNPKKPKRGGSQLAMLESKLGALPPTWTSSARDNGVAGIRFFLAPSELEWRGNCSEAGAPHIDIISLQHKYAIVYPSIHPKGGQYLWFPPGVSPSGPSALEGFDWSSVKGIGNGSGDGNGGGYSDPAETGDICVVPNVADLAVLPNDWVDYLTRNRTVALTSDDVAIDMDSTLKELMQWASKEFVPRRGMCKMMREAVAKHVENIENNDDHHYPLQEAHWHLLRLGAEGHHGWSEAIGIAENAWRERISDEGRNVSKRSKEKAERELKRSREGALRKVKGEADKAIEDGLSLLSKIELCYEPDGNVDGVVGGMVGGAGGIDDGGDWLGRVVMDDQPDPKDYEDNDISQARFFLDVFGSSVRYVPEIGRWMIYDGFIWHIDEFGSVIYLYERGCLKQTKARMLKGISDMEQYMSGTGNSKTDPAYKQLSKIVARCKRSYDKYSNSNALAAMLKVAGQKRGVSISFSELNHDDTVIAMPNGKVIRLARRGRDEDKNKMSQGYWVEDNQRAFYTTMKTKAVFKTREELESTEQGRQQLSEWMNTLKLILPDVELRRFVQRVFGHMLLGGNDEKKMVFLSGRPHTGKSTLLNSFDVLGDYAGGFNPASLMEDKGSAPNPELLSNWHRRVIQNSESGMNRLDAGMIKKVTGRDRMTCRTLYSKNIVSGEIKFTVIMATNKVPKVIGEDTATRNRMLILPIETVVSRDKDDKSMTTAIAERCRDAIFLWLLDGYREYVRQGLDQSTWAAEALARTIEFNSRLSPVGSFLEDVCDIAPDEIMRAFGHESAGAPASLKPTLDEWSKHKPVTVFEYYKEWLGEGERHLPRNDFYSDLAGHGIIIKKRRHGGEKATSRVMCGIKIRKDAIADIRRERNRRDIG